MSRLGLRGKSIIALVLASLLALLPVSFLGWHILVDVREHAALSFAKNYTRLNREKILAPVSRELALSQRLAGSVLTRQWMLDENNPAKRELFFQEAAGYQADFRDHSWSAAVDSSHHYYFNDAGHPLSELPRHTLSPSEKSDGWYFASVASGQDFNLNVDLDVPMQLTKVWFNVLVEDGGKTIGVAGTGMDLTRFLKDFIVTDKPGVTAMILDIRGDIQAHPDHRLIALNSGVGQHSAAGGVFSLLSDEASRQALRQLMQGLTRAPGDVQSAWVQFGGAATAAGGHLDTGVEVVRSHDH